MKLESQMPIIKIKDKQINKFDPCHNHCYYPTNCDNIGNQEYASEFFLILKVARNTTLRYFEATLHFIIILYILIILK